MKTKKYFQIVVLLLSIGSTTVWGQSKMIQKETDNRNQVSFVKFATDTIIPMKDAAYLLKKLQPQTKEADEWKLSTKRKEIKDEAGYRHQFYRQYYIGVCILSCTTN